MVFKISYRVIIWNVVLINLLIVLVALVSHLGHHPMKNEQVPYAMLVVDVLLLFFFILNPPPKCISVDKKARLLSYKLLFRFQDVVLDYNKIRSEWKTRTGARGSSWMELIFYVDEQILFSLAPGTTGWTKEELNKMHLYLLRINKKAR